MIKPVTQDHLRAVRSRDHSKAGLLLRAEYCDFMAQSAGRPAIRDLWEISAIKRLREATGDTRHG